MVERVGRRAGRLMLVALLVFAALSGVADAQNNAKDSAKPIKLVALGDSLTAGLGLPASDLEELTSLVNNRSTVTITD